VCAPECAGACPVPDATGWPAIVLRAMRPPVLPDALSDPTSGFPGVPESNRMGPIAPWLELVVYTLVTLLSFFSEVVGARNNL
jgi:hypothetical protein